MICVIAELSDCGVEVDLHDPWIVPADAKSEYGLDLVTTPEAKAYDGVVLDVAHDSYRDAGATALRAYGRDDHVFSDLKCVFRTVKAI